MGIFAEGFICLGWKLESELPASCTGSFDFKKFWLDAKGFSPSVQLFDEVGNFLNGVQPSAKEEEAYYAERDAFLDAHPVEVDLLNAGSGDDPVWILAIPTCTISVHPGSPKVIDPEGFVMPAYEAMQRIEKDLRDIGLTISPGPKWFLASYFSY